MTEIKKWCLILGASGGLGSAIVLALAKRQFNILGVHLDTAEQSSEIEKLAEQLHAMNVTSQFFNINAANEKAMQATVSEIAQLCGQEGGIRVFVHAMAFGTLLPLIRKTPLQPILTRRQMDMTMLTMAHSFVYWTQELLAADLLNPGAKLFALTSIGSTNVLESYGAVSAAKSALESHCRQLACELAPYDIAVNAIRAGITATPALLKIPNAQDLIERATRYNPYQKLTTPNEIGEAIALLSLTNSSWLTGNVIGVDGGEKLTL